MASEYQEFSERMNRSLREKRGVRVGGEPESDPRHDEFNSMIRDELRRRGVEPENPSRGGEG